MASHDLDRLSRHFALDPDAARRAAITAATTDIPWYMTAAIGVGAWLAAIAAIGTVASVVALFDVEPGVLAAIFGVACAAAGVAVWRHSTSAFARQFAIASALGGQALIAGGLAAEQESMTVAATTAAITAAVLLPLIHDPVHRFLAAAMALSLILAALLVEEVPQAGGLLVAVTLPVALGLLLRPPAGLDLRGLAPALLLVPVSAQAVLEIGAFETDWLARLVYAAGLLAVLGMLWRGATPGAAPGVRPVILAAGAVALLLGLTTTAGMLASLLLLALAFILGSREMAAIGVVAQIWFVGWFYYALTYDLMTKSGMLTGAGTLLLALWWLWSRAPGRELGR